MNKILLRQINKHLGGEDKVPDKIKGLLKAIDLTYDGFDNDRALIERSLDISSKELSEINNTLRQYLEIAGVIFVTLNKEGQVTLINKKGCEVFGYEKEEVIGKNWFDNFLPKTINKNVKKVFLNLIMGKVEQVEFYENVVVTKKGEEKLIAWHNSMLKDKNGQIIGILSSGDDVTERRKAEIALKESEEKYRIITENSADLISLMTFELIPKFLYISPSNETVLGYKAEELIGKSGIDLVHPDDRKNLTLLLKRYLIEKAKNIIGFRSMPWKEMINYRVKAKDGSWKYLECSANLVGDKIVLISRDATERKKNAEEIERLVAIVHSSNEMINMATPDGKMTFVNQAGSKMLGIAAEEVGQHNIMEVVSGPYQEIVKKEVLPTLMKKGKWEGDLQYLNIKTGQPIDVHAMTFPIKDKETGEVTYLVNVSQDITERKKTLDGLRIKNKELESFTKISVDRELKMVELKRKIKELESELSRS